MARKTNYEIQQEAGNVVAWLAGVVLLVVIVVALARVGATLNKWTMAAPIKQVRGQR